MFKKPIVPQVRNASTFVIAEFEKSLKASPLRAGISREVSVGVSFSRSCGCCTCTFTFMIFLLLVKYNKGADTKGRIRDNITCDRLSMVAMPSLPMNKAIAIQGTIAIDLVTILL
ncbi:hypothetical protein OGATHE_003913 [Ogataea polymorpha]|uniref:Uncharacterized protein n=1 Tax=Ogataea polymorpha TaxID=460523 RepID=A0A9P8P3X0_9ASCO|nr:hypothetical protein OGATHE_003913 [Ogataea polymorpha]